MKRSVIFWIVLGVLAIVVLANFLFNVVFFENLHKNITPASEAEKREAINILSRDLNLSGYEIKVWNVYSPRDKAIVQVDLMKGESRKHYLIDLKEGKIIRK